MYKGVYDSSIIFALPLSVIGLGIITGLTLGPWLIKRAAKKSGLAVPSWVSRAGRCVAAGFLAAVVSIGSLIGASLLAYAVSRNNELASLAIALILNLGAAIGIVVGISNFCGVPLRAADLSTLPLPGRKRVYSIGIIAVLFVAAGWFAWLATLNRVRFLSMEGMDATNMRGIGTAMVLYHAQYDQYPDHLGQLADSEHASYNMFRLPTVGMPIERNPDKGKPYPAPPWLNYAYLPDGAPADVLWVWPDPKVYDGERFHVLYRNGEVRRMYPDQLPAELEKLKRWQAENQQGIESAVEDKNAAGNSKDG